MLTNIYVPKWFRWLVVLAVGLQVVMGLAHLSTAAWESLGPGEKGHYTQQELILRYSAELDRCEAYGKAMEERLADEREARQQ